MTASCRKYDLYASWMPRAPRWYVAVIMPGNEGIAIEHLVRQGFEIYIPMMVNRQVNDHGKWADVRRYRFRGYGFVSLDLDQDQWRSVNGTRGVRYLLPQHLERPTPLPVGFIERLMAMPEKTEQIIIEFAIDDLVRFVAGPFETYHARIVAQDDQKLRARLPSGAMVNTTTDAVELVDRA